jgi:hypothetical protein
MIKNLIMYLTKDWWFNFIREMLEGGPKKKKKKKKK